MRSAGGMELFGDDDGANRREPFMVLEKGKPLIRVRGLRRHVSSRKEEMFMVE